MSEAVEMGRVTVTAKIENLSDRMRSESGDLPAEEVRTLVVEDALVDTGATRLSLPTSMIESLGLTEVRRGNVQTASGMTETGLYSAVWLTVQDRYCPIDVIELPEGCPVLVGQVPLELMDWVVDPHGQQLIGNPAHGGEWMSELY